MFTSYGVVCFRPCSAKGGNDEARSHRFRKRGHFGCDHWGAERECTGLQPLRCSSNLFRASQHASKPRLGSPRRSARCSVCQLGQSASHGRRKPRLQSKSLELVTKKTRVASAVPIPDFRTPLI